MTKNTLFQFSRALCVPLCILLAASSGVAQTVQAEPIPCVDGECAPVITEEKFAGRDAYRFSDGKTQAVVVPSLGRVMSYGMVDGPNLLFQNKAAKPDPKNPTAWVNYGGDKTWPAPQEGWILWQKSGGWPPPRQWDGEAHEAEVLTGGKLRLTSPVHPGLGGRVARTFSLSPAGEFVIEQSIEKLSGGPLSLSIWSVTQIEPPDAIYLRSNPDSPYKNGFHYIGNDATKQFAITRPRPEMVRVEPSKDGVYKIGVDTPVVALASVKGQVAFVQKSARPEGQYPDGALNAGFPMEIYNNTSPAYVELELLGPLRAYFGSKDGKSVGTRWTHTVRWSLHQLADASDEDEIARLLS